MPRIIDFTPFNPNFQTPGFCFRALFLFLNVYRPSSKGCDKDVTDEGGGGGGTGTGGTTNSSTEKPSRWGFKNRDQRGSDRRRQSSSQQQDNSKSDTSASVEQPAGTTPTAATRGSSLRFQVPSRSGGRKTSTSTDPARTSTVTTTKSGGREAIVYSPASSSFSMTSVSSTPCSDMFFASGNTTPSHVTSPPPHSHFGSPLIFSPPISPPPALSSSRAMMMSSVPSTIQELTPLVLSPVPQSASRAGSRTPTAIKTAPPDLTSPVKSTNTYLSVSGLRMPTKSKTDDLERYITEIEAGEAANMLQSAAAGSFSAGATPTKEHKKYTKRRYTDSRHPTTELPDVSAQSTGAINESMTLERPLLRRRPQQLA